MLGWGDIIYSNGAIRKEECSEQGGLAGLAQSSQGAILLSQAICLVVTVSLSRSPSLGEGAHKTEGDIYLPRVSGVAARSPPHPALNVRPWEPSIP